jgi:hypothetical protein
MSRHITVQIAEIQETPVDEPPKPNDPPSPVDEPPGADDTPAQEPPPGPAPDDIEPPVRDPRVPGQPARKDVD